MSVQKYYARQNPKIYPQGLYEESSTQKVPLGTQWHLADGRSYIYCKNGASALAVGMLLQTAPLDSLAVSMVLNTAAAVGDDHVHATYGAGTTAVANYFKEGYCHIAETTVGVGAGHMYKIDHHAAAISGGDLAIYLKDNIRVACTVTTAQVTCVKHKCDSVVIQATSVTGYVIGVSIMPVTASYYFWAQYRGPASVLVDTGDTLIIGSYVTGSIGGTVAGACRVGTENEEYQIIGTAHAVGAADSFAIVDLSLL